MSWARLCIRYNNNPLRSILFASKGNDDVAGFNYNLEGIDKITFYGSIEPQNKMNKFCYSYKKAADGLTYMDFYKVDICSPPSNGEALNLQEGGYGGAIYLYTSKPDEQLNLSEYIYRYATDIKGVTRTMISHVNNKNWSNSNDWTGGGTFWAYTYDKGDDNQFIICGSSCMDLPIGNPLFQLSDGYCYNKGSNALSDFSKRNDRKTFDYNCDGSLIHHENLNGNGDADSDDNLFQRYDVDPSSETDQDDEMYILPKDSNYPYNEVLPVINIFKNVSGGADDIYGLFKKLTLNDKYLLCQRPESASADNILKHSYSVKYMMYSAISVENDIKNKYIKQDSQQCIDTMNSYCKINWGKSGQDCYNYCRYKEVGNDVCEPTIKNYCTSDNNINLPICKETINNIIEKYPDRRPVLLKDLRNKWLDLNKNRLTDDDVLKFCKADDTTIAAKQSNLDTTMKSRCDSLYKDFCTSRTGSQDPKIKKICSCINGKTIANILIPQCHDGVCMQEGYKTADMIGYVNCPKCVNILSIKNVASSAQIANIKQDMICKVEENNTTTTSNNTTTETEEQKNSADTSADALAADKAAADKAAKAKAAAEAAEEDATTEANNIYLYIIIALFVIICIFGVIMVVSNNSSSRSKSRKRAHRSRHHR